MLLRKGLQRINYKNKMMPVCEEDYFYLDRGIPFKIFHNQGERDEYLIVTSDHVKFKG